MRGLQFVVLLCAVFMVGGCESIMEVDKREAALKSGWVVGRVYALRTNAAVLKGYGSITKYRAVSFSNYGSPNPSDHDATLRNFSRERPMSAGTRLIVQRVIVYMTIDYTDFYVIGKVLDGPFEGHEMSVGTLGLFLHDPVVFRAASGETLPPAIGHILDPQVLSPVSDGRPDR